MNLALALTFAVLLDGERIGSRRFELGQGRYRISGMQQPIELTYSPQGNWLALESTVEGGRRLTYPLE